MGRHLCGLYYDYPGEGESAQRELGETVKLGAVGQLGITSAAVLFREGKYEEAFKSPRPQKSRDSITAVPNKPFQE